MGSPTMDGDRDGRPSRRRRVLVWAKRLALVAVALGAGAAIALFVVLGRYEAELPSTRELKGYRPLEVTRVVARDGTLLGEIFVERRTVVPLARIPAQMKLAALAAEDAAFYEHAGLNYLGMLRALAKNLRSSEARQGGSTITQQVIKNVLLTPERTMDRKIREALLARRIEQELTKDEILELYLNHIYFGHGRYGVEEASRYYFGKGVESVSLAEAALLAGVVKGPSIYSPRVDPARSAVRRAYVLEQMERKQFASPAQVASALATPVELAPEPVRSSELAPEVVDEAERTLRAAVGPAAARGGYTVTTTVDPELQRAARASLQKGLDDHARRQKLLGPLARQKRELAPFEGTPAGKRHRVLHGVVTGADDERGTLSVRLGSVEGKIDLRGAARYNPKNLAPSAFADEGRVLRVSLVDPLPTPSPDGANAAPVITPSMRLELGAEGALVAVDVRTREVLALVGGYEAARKGLDRASFARRQPGSSFKPFVYGYALHARTMTPATLLETDPAALSGYRPGNFDAREGGPRRRLRDAVSQSVNVAAAYTLQQVGAPNVVAFAQALGITSRLEPEPSLALGAYEVTPREMAGAYAALAAGGVYEAPVLVTRIVGPDGRDVPLPPRAPARRVMGEAEAYVLTSVLSSVVEVGTGRRARALGRPIAGKTGTSNKAKDAWFVGYSTDVACAVWTGFDDASPLGPGESGATAALPTFVEFMRMAHAGRPVALFPVPPGLTRVLIDPETGLLARAEQDDALEEIFVTGTEPTETAADPEAEAGADEPADAELPAREGDGEKPADGAPVLAAATPKAATEPPPEETPDLRPYVEAPPPAMPPDSPELYDDPPPF